LKEEFGVASSLLVKVVTTTGGPYGEKLGEELDEGSELFAVRDRQDPIWVPERLVRKARLPWTPENVEAIMSDAATSSAAGEDGTTVGDPVTIPEANADTA
ncbi:hypothetical protein STEG23_038229, partial [Scotinomys teguina]